MNVYEKITNVIIEKLEKGVIAWQQEWQPASNFITKHVYTGVNRLILSSESTYFMTFKQIQNKKWKLKKGSKGFPVIFMGAYTAKNEEEEEVIRRVMKYYTVFKIEDVEGIPAEEIIEAKKEIIDAEEIVKKYKDSPKIIEKGSRCCYMPLIDTVQMPSINSFKTVEGYYSSLFHELGHSTGAKHRLNRSLLTQKNSAKYAQEELIAELTSAFLCQKAGVKMVIDNQASYIASWLKALKNDKRLIITASSQAEKATNYILNQQKEELKKCS